MSINHRRHPPRDPGDRDLAGAGAAGTSGRSSRRGHDRPYALQDFNLYYLTRYGFRPSKIAYLSWCAGRDADGRYLATKRSPRFAPGFDLGEIKRWLRIFLERFFTSQFKRTAMPNGPKISSGGSLSPRGDWRAPSEPGRRFGWRSSTATSRIKRRLMI